MRFISKYQHLRLNVEIEADESEYVEMINKETQTDFKN